MCICIPAGHRPVTGTVTGLEQVARSGHTSQCGGQGPACTWGVIVVMDTGVERGSETGRGTAAPSDAHAEQQQEYAQQRPVYDDAPTMILDLRAAFAEAGPSDAPPLGIVQVEREHPVRAGLAFLAVLGLIAAGAGGLVVATAAIGKAAYDRFAGPPQCTTAQVADGDALAGWLTDLTRETVGTGTKIVRTGCTTAGVLDPLDGQSAAITVGASKPDDKVIAALKQRDCSFGQSSTTGVRSCTVEIGSRLAAVELRPSKDRTVTTFTVSFR